VQGSQPLPGGSFRVTQRLGRYSRGGNANPLQYSCLENSMDSGAWWATVHGDAGKLVFKFIYLCIIFFFFGYAGSSLLPGVFSSCDSLVEVHWLLLTAVASLVAEHGLYLQASVLAAHGLSSCGTRA